MAGISARRRKLEMTRRRCGIGKGVQLGKFREAENAFNFMGGELPIGPTFAEILARWLGEVEATGKRGSAGDEFGEGVIARGRNRQGGKRRKGGALTDLSTDSRGNFGWNSQTNFPFFFDWGDRIWMVTSQTWDGRGVGERECEIGNGRGMTGCKGIGNLGGR